MERQEAKKRRALRLNIALLKLSRNWLRVALVLIGIYITLPWVAPTLMHLGAEAPARVLYTLYSPFCHQFAFRSLFVYGDQVSYPRAISGTALVPFEDAAPSPEWEQAVADNVGFAGRMFASVDQFDPYIWSPDLQFASRQFLGNDRMGYKTTLCARDVAIYTGIFVGGLIYSIPTVRRRLRPVPLWLYVILGLGPIGIDGFSQLLGYPPFNFWQPREAEPVFRVLTGGLFGLMNAWLGFPHLDASFKETAAQISDKLARRSAE